MLAGGEQVILPANICPSLERLGLFLMGTLQGLQDRTRQLHFAREKAVCLASKLLAGNKNTKPKGQTS